MSVSIPETVLQETDKCPHDFSCLETGKCGTESMCEVNHADGKNILFLESDEPASCPYRLTFGYSQVCRCPTHYEIEVETTQ